jgi:Sulfatase
VTGRDLRAGAPVGRAEAIAFGVLAGAVIGLLAGLTEAIASPLTLPWRRAFVVAADVWVGAGWGFLASLPPALTSGARRRGLAAVAGFVVAVALFPCVAAVLGLFVNRVLLSGTHFLSRTSLFADLVAIVTAGALSLFAGRSARRFLAGARPPRPGIVLALLLPPLAVLLAPRLLGPGAPSGADPRTIVVISIDTLRPDRVGAGGFPDGTSPELDRLCREGLQFPVALAVSPGSAASHAALFTSRYPVSNGVWENFSIMDEEVVTAAELARDEGYRTGGFLTNTFLGRPFHFDQGFDTYVESGQVERLRERGTAALFRSLSLVQIVDRLRVRLQPGYDPSFETALRWLRESDGATFAFVHLMDVHSPYAPPEPWGPRFGAQRRGHAEAGRRRNRFGWVPSEEAYAAEVRFADTKIGRLRRVLAETGRLDDAVILLTSDHGENLLDHEPNYSHGQTLYDATLRILAALRAPGIPTSLDGSVVENVDLLPTLAAVIGWPRHDDWEGDALLPAEPVRPDTTVAQLTRDFCVRTATRKYIVREGGGRDWFLLDRDPGETGAALLGPAERKRLDEYLTLWLAAHTTELYGDRATSIDPDDLSPELREKLRALGYVQ